MYVVRIDLSEDGASTFEAFEERSRAQQSLNAASWNIAHGQAVRAFLFAAPDEPRSEAAIETVRGGGGRLIQRVSGQFQA